MEAEIQATPPKPVGPARKKRSRKIQIAAVIFVLIIVAVVLWLLQLQNAPAKAVIRQGSATLNGHQVAAAKLIPYTDNPYVNYSYWSSYHISATSLDSPGTLSRAEFLLNAPYRQMEVFTEKAPNGFSGESAIAFRRQKKDLYTEQSLIIDGSPALSFVRTDQGYERVTFIQKSGMLSVVSITSNDNSGSTQEQYQKVLDSVHWK